MGNPSEEYENSPHNAGFLCIDELCKHFKIKMNKSLGSIIYSDIEIMEKRVVFAKPLTFMNESGRGVVLLKNKLHFEDKDMVVIYDDIDISISDIRVRKKGGAGNHKGMMSIINLVGSEAFPRIRIGINDMQKNIKDVVRYVLTPLKGKKLEELKSGVFKGVDAVIEIIKTDIDSVMNKFNKKINVPHKGSKDFLLLSGG